MFIKKSNSITVNISKTIALASLLCVGANANEIKNQEIIKVFYQNATSNSLLVKKEINEANETFKNVSSVLNNKKNAIARLVEINKVKNPETRKFMLNIYLNQLAEIEKKYDKSLIDYPNSKNLEDQVKNILNSDLVELVDKRILITYSTLKNKVKFKDDDIRFRDIVANSMEEVVKLTKKLEALSLNPYNNILEVTYDAELGGDRKYNENLKNYIIEENNLNKTLIKLINENRDEQIFTNNEIQTFISYLKVKRTKCKDLSEDNRSYLKTKVIDMEDRIIYILNDFVHENKSVGLNIF